MFSNCILIPRINKVNKKKDNISKRVTVEKELLRKIRKKKIFSQLSKAVYFKNEIRKS